MPTVSYMDQYQENEDLKEEIQKLSSKVNEEKIVLQKIIDHYQVEFYKIVDMMSSNHQFKKRGYSSIENRLNQVAFIWSKSSCLIFKFLARETDFWEIWGKHSA